MKFTQILFLLTYSTALTINGMDILLKDGAVAHLTSNDFAVLKESSQLIADLHSYYSTSAQLPLPALNKTDFDLFFALAKNLNGVNLACLPIGALIKRLEAASYLQSDTVLGALKNHFAWCLNGPKKEGWLENNAVLLKKSLKYFTPDLQESLAKEPIWKIPKAFTEHTTLSDLPNNGWAVAIAPTGQYLAIGSAGKVELWDYAGKLLRVLPHSLFSDPVLVAIDSTGSRLVAAESSDSYWGGKHTIAKVWDAASGKCLCTITGHTGQIHALAIDPMGKYLVTSSDDKAAKIWDAASGKCLRTLTGHTQNINALAIDPMGKYLVTGSSDSTVKIWDAASGKCLRTITGHTQSINALAIDPTGKYLVTGSYDKTAKIWDITSGLCLHTLTGHTKSVNALAIDPTGTYLITNSHDKTIKMWDITSGSCLKTVADDADGRFNSVAIDPTGKYWVTASGGKAKMWKVEKFDDSEELEAVEEFKPQSSCSAIYALLGKLSKIFS